MNRSWFLFFGGIGIFISTLGPHVPVPDEWKTLVSMLPMAITSFLTFIGNQAYDRNPDGTKSTGTGDGTKGTATAPTVVVLPPTPKEEKPEEP